MSTTLDIYSHVLPGLQEVAVRRFGEGRQEVPVEMAANAVRRQNVGSLDMKRGFEVEF